MRRRFRITYLRYHFKHTLSLILLLHKADQRRQIPEEEANVISVMTPSLTGVYYAGYKEI